MGCQVLLQVSLFTAFQYDAFTVYHFRFLNDTPWVERGPVGVKCLAQEQNISAVKG